MSVESDEAESQTRKTHLRKLFQSVSVDFIGSLVVTIVTLLIGIVGNLVGSWLSGAHLQIASEYLTLSMVIVSIGLGLVTMFYGALSVYRQRERQRLLTFEQLREREKEFFQTVERDITALLQRRGSDGE